MVDLKSKIKYTSPKKLAQKQKLLIIKLKKIKPNKLNLSKTTQSFKKDLKAYSHIKDKKRVEPEVIAIS